MKKLLLSALVVSAAAFVQAAAANWMISCANIFNGAGSEDSVKIAQGTDGYFFDGTKITQEDVYNAWSKGSCDFTSLTGYILTSATTSPGIFSGVSTTFSYGEQDGKPYTFFFVIPDGDKALFSNVITKKSNETTTQATIAFGNMAPTDGSPSSKDLPTNGYVGAGRWAAVPEPTSALLMLLGMAGLAIRRRRA